MLHVKSDKVPATNRNIGELFYISLKQVFGSFIVGFCAKKLTISLLSVADHFLIAISLEQGWATVSPQATSVLSIYENFNISRYYSMMHKAK